MARRAWVLAAGAAVVMLALGCLRWVVPFLTADRAAVASTPSLGPFESRVTFDLAEGDEACVRPVTFTPETRVAQFRVNAPRRPVPPIAVRAVAPGYRAQGRVAGYDRGGDQVVQARLHPPERTVRGRLCFANAGERRVSLIGNAEIRSAAIAETLVDGEVREGEDLELSLFQGDPQPLAGRAGELVDRASLMTGGTLPSWLLWALLVLVGAGAPTALVVALAVAWRRPPSRPPRRRTAR